MLALRQLPAIWQYELQYLSELNSEQRQPVPIDTVCKINKGNHQYLVLPPISVENILLERRQNDTVLLVGT
jgi:hypothetical protein